MIILFIHPLPLHDAPLNNKRFNDKYPIGTVLKARSNEDDEWDIKGVLSHTIFPIYEEEKYCFKVLEP